MFLHRLTLCITNDVTVNPQGNSGVRVAHLLLYNCWCGSLCQHLAGRQLGGAECNADAVASASLWSANACTELSQEMHEAALVSFRVFGQVRTTEELAHFLASTNSPSPAAGPIRSGAAS